MPAAAAEAASSASVVSTRAQTSSRRVAAARAASSTLVRPEEAKPEISLRHPRGRPPVRESISRMPLETLSGEGRTASRDAGVTPASLGTAANRCKTCAGSLTKTALGRPQADCAQTCGEDNLEPQNFRERHFA